jgi:hypothetical protein
VHSQWGSSAGQQTGLDLAGQTLNTELGEGPADAGPDLRCATWTRVQAVDPIGTAGSATAVLAVEWPQPWPARMEEVPELRRLLEETAGAGVQLQAVVPDRSDPFALRVMAYTPSPGAGFEKTEATASRGDLVATALRLLRDPSPAPRSPLPDGVLDVQICAHGRRDRCCGSLGTRLATRLLAQDSTEHRIRIWRTSHTGGHRFAPTAIVLPQGTVWAYLNEDSLLNILHRSGDLEELLPHYRGYLRLGSPALQAIERAVLAEVGWPLFDMARWGEELGGGHYRLHVETPSGGSSVWDGTVRTTRTLPVPVCGEPIEHAVKSQVELAVGELARVHLKGHRDPDAT